MKISCPCGEEIEVSDVLLEQTVRCPQCGQPVKLPVALDAGEGTDDFVAEVLPVATDGEAIDALAMAIDSPVARPSARPSNPSRTPNGNGGEEEAGPGKRRHRLPIIITAVAFGLLIIVAVVVIAVTGNDPATKSSQPAGQESGQTVRPAAKTPSQTAPRGSYGGNAELFPNVRGNRTRKDYEEEQRRKRESGQ